MNIPNYLLVIFALVPALVLLVYIYIKDRSEKEPIGLLLLLVFCGAVICLPAGEIEHLLGKVIDSLFSLFVVVKEDTAYFISSEFYYLYHLVDNIIGIALIEEGLKWLVLFLITRKNKNFNSLFDGVIYAICVSLGFAAFENIFYVLENGFTNAVTRAVTAVPGHMFFAVFMGYYYTQWHFNKRIVEVEDALYQSRLVFSKYAAKELSESSDLLKSIIIPVLIHGFYDFVLSLNSSSIIETVIIWVVFLAFLAILYFVSFRRIRQLSKIDANDTYAAVAVLNQYHPGLLEIIVKEYGGEKKDNLNYTSAQSNSNADNHVSIVANKTEHNFRGVYFPGDGIVEKIYINVGQHISPGTDLLRIHNSLTNEKDMVRATFSGTVHSINCSENDLINSKKVLCVIDNV